VLKKYQDEGKTVALPVVVKSSEKDFMEFRKWSKNEDLVSSSFHPKILEPNPEAPVVVPNIIICPLLCFEETTCHRLGYGGAFYDRYLQIQKNSPALTIGVASENFKFEPSLEIPEFPYDHFDYPLDCIVTENAIYFKS
jgi:5-formyltetrahydrofolate cyclo-ligase